MSTLRLRIIIPIILCLFTGAVALYLTQARVERSRTAVLENGQVLLRALMSQLQESLSTQLIESDEITARRNLSSVALNPGIVTLLLADENHQVLLANRYVWEGQAASRVSAYDALVAEHVRESMSGYVSPQPKLMRLRGYFPVTLGIRQGELRPNRVGSLYVEYDMSGPFAAGQREAYRDALQLCGFFIVAAVVQAILLHLLFTRRVERLASTVGEFATGNMSARAQMGGKDEIGTLGQAFDLMAANLADHDRALRESEERFRLLIEQSPLGISISGGDGELNYVNAKFVEMFGYRREDFPHGMEWVAKAYPGEAYQEEMAIRLDDLDSCEGPENRLPVFSVTCKDGTEKIVCFRPVLMRSGTQFVIYEDVTESKRSEETLRWDAAVTSALSALYRSLISPDVSLDKMALSILHQARMLTGSEHGFVSSVDAETGSNVACAFTEMMKKQPSAFLEDHRLVFPRGSDGRYAGLLGESLNTRQAFYANTPSEHPACSGLPPGHVQLSQFLSVPVLLGPELVGEIALANPGRDYTARDLRAVQRLGEFYALAIQRERATLDQRRLEEQLTQAQKMESIGRLAGGVAHDFNNMLSVILGYSEMLMERLPAGSEFHGEVLEIFSAGERAQNLTRQLLAFSRKQILEVKTMDLCEVVFGIEKMTGRLLGEDIRIHIKANPGVCYVKADLSQLEQVLMNLCLNARDAMPQGGVVTIEVAPVQLDAHYVSRHPGIKPGAYVLLNISDTGCGMDEATKRQIFDPFFTTKEKGKGTGLGLATVFGIVKQHGGDIWVYSEPEHGSTFKIYLPRVPGPTKPMLMDKQEVMALGHGEIVLVIEDEEIVRRLTCQMLDRLGYVTLEARNLEECLDLAQRTERVDLLLTDVIMPGINGRQVHESVLQVCPKIKALYMSGYTEEVIAHHGILDAGVHFIPKPFSEIALSRKVREALDA